MLCMDAGSETGSDGETVSREGQTVEREGNPEQTAGRRKPAVTRRNDPAEDNESSPGVITPTEPPKPQAIDPENAAFVLLGVVVVVGLVLAAVAGF